MVFGVGRLSQKRTLPAVIGVFRGVRFRRDGAENVGRPPNGGAEFAASTGFANAKVIVARSPSAIDAIEHLPVGPVLRPTFAGGEPVLRATISIDASANLRSSVRLFLIDERAFAPLKLAAQDAVNRGLFPPQQDARGGALGELDRRAADPLGDSLDKLAVPFGDQDAGSRFVDARRCCGRVKPVGEKVRGNGRNEVGENRTGEASLRLADEAVPAGRRALKFVNDAERWCLGFDHGGIVAAKFRVRNRESCAPNRSMRPMPLRVTRDLGCSLDR